MKLKFTFISNLAFVLLSHFSNAQSLTSLSGGVTTNGIVYSMAYDSAANKLYVGGYFKAMDGTAMENFGMWDGSVWSSLNANLDGPVLAMKLVGSDLYVGGYFQHVNGIPVSSVAKWDGTTWSGLGTGVNFVIRSMEYFQGKLYATGNIPYVATSYLQSYDGTTWTNVADINYPPVGLIARDTDIVVYGRFTTINTDSVPGIASFNGTGWNYFPAPFSFVSIGGAVLVRDTLFILNYSIIYKWSNGSWDSIANAPLYHEYQNIFSYHDSLFVVDDTSYTSTHVTYLRKCEQGILSNPIGQMSLDYVYNQAIYSFQNYSNKLFIGGSFDRINNKTALSVLQYDGTAWTNPGKPSWLSYIDAWQNTDVWNDYLDSVSNEWYIGGKFYFAGQHYAANIAKWNGTTWQGVGTGFNESVYKIIKFGGILYAVGRFTYSGNTPINHIAMWNGTQWIQVGTGSNGSIYDAMIFNNELYFAGNFDTINGVNANYIAKFNGFAWSAVGNNVLDERVYKLTSNNGQLIASGVSAFSFAFPDMSPVAILNGGQWSIMDPSLNIFEGPQSFYHYNNEFYFAYDDNSNYLIYKWNGSHWVIFDTIGTGFGSASFFEMNNELYVGIINNGLFKFDGTGFNYVSDIMPLLARQYNGETLLAGFIPWFYAGGLTQIDINNVAKIDFTLPQITISSNTDTICAHQYVYFDAQTADPFATMQWHTPGGVPDTISVPDPIIHYLNPGTFPVYLVATNMTGTDTIYLSHDITVQTCAVGMEENFEASGTIYPNPAADKLFIKSNQEIKSVIVEDLNGRVMKKFNGNVSSLTISDLTPGIYLLTVIGPDAVFKKKIVKQ